MRSALFEKVLHDYTTQVSDDLLDAHGYMSDSKDELERELGKVVKGVHDVFTTLKKDDSR
jgi:SMC interacting uncharacterized protein involved in chromosome segregation